MVEMTESRLRSVKPWILQDRNNCYRASMWTDADKTVLWLGRLPFNERNWLVLFYFSHFTLCISSLFQAFVVVACMPLNVSMSESYFLFHQK